MKISKLCPRWRSTFQEQMKEDYMKSLAAFLISQKKQGKLIYPKESQRLRAFELTPFDQVKVVILGQDPYHGEGQAHGLAFSVSPGVKPPPSLLNIYKELASDLGIKSPKHGNLESWAKQGVLLLNSVLSVQEAKPASHSKQGWEKLTDKIIQKLSDQKQELVFILWGRPAQKKGLLIDAKKHFILKSSHPSPLASYRGFFGSRHFSKTNDFLVQKNKAPIDWQLPDL